ncbi:unnamed protein product [Polarella glacialis]|uniref:Secreted protein n=1 Tax=Polarella glacialis TaxID=89957 RepID=A0A813L1G8_POLGL|nr:unnamed protein product [Polarella glacialis]
MAKISVSKLLHVILRVVEAQLFSFCGQSGNSKCFCSADSGEEQLSAARAWHISVALVRCLQLFVRGEAKHEANASARYRRSLDTLTSERVQGTCNAKEKI